MGSHVEYFNKKIEDIGELALLPNDVRRYAINALNRMERTAVKRRGSQHPIDSTIQTLENINDDSINDKYKIVYNQLNILATSALEATLKHYFIDCLRDTTLLNRGSDKLRRRLDSIKVTAFDLVQNDLDYKNRFAELIMEKEGSNFQNLKKIKGVFSDYFSKDIELSDDDTRRIIFYTECRHILVHKSGRIDKNFIRNTENNNYIEANIKRYKEKDEVGFDAGDWEDMTQAYTALVREVIKN